MVKNDTKLSETDIKTMIQKELQAQLVPMVETIQNNLKMREKMLYSAVESLSTSVNLMQKEFNLKIGALKGHQERRNKPKEDDVLVEFNSPEEFQAWLDAQKIKQEQPSKQIEPLSNNYDTDMITELMDK